MTGTMTVARSLDEALGALAARPEATVLAGGTDLMVEVNAGRRRPQAVVAVGRVPELLGVSVEGGRVRIGAATTYRDLAAAPTAALLPGLADAARSIGSVQIRNAGTIGGNIATASPAGDTLPLLLALDAQVGVVGAGGRRTVALRQLLAGPKRSALEPGELIHSVLVRPGGRHEYLKAGGRSAMVISVASVAVVVDGLRRRAAVGLGAVGPTARRAPNVEAYLHEQADFDTLRWKPGTSRQERQEAITACARADAAPIDDHRGSARYRRRVVGVLCARGAERILGDAP